MAETPAGLEAGEGSPSPDVLTYEFGSEVVCMADSRSEEVEAIRTVRTHLIARHLEDGRRAVSLCAASANSGCTFTAVNLAVSLSQAGVNTLLVDADLRKPRVDEFIRPSRPPAGMVQWLTSPTDQHLSTYVHAEVLPNLSIVYAGGAAENAQELLAGDEFRRFVERCLRDFEFTIIDTPPLNTCSDALRISKLVGYTIVVARSNVSRTADVTSLANLLREDGSRVVGTILYDR